MDIDITEIMKTGLFELRYEKIDGFEEWSITPIKTDFRIHSGVLKANEPENGFTVNRKMGDRYALLHTVSYDPEDWAPEFDDVSSEFTDVESLKGSWEENIPWHEIPEKYSWVAMDEDGQWDAYENCPEVVENSKMWDIYFGDRYVIRYTQMPTPPHWTESLVRRPDYEQKAT